MLRVYLACFLLVSCGTTALGQQTSVVLLKESGFDFALDLPTGNVAVIDNAAGTARLYAAAYFQGDSSKATPPLKIGANPASITFKPYRDKRYFVVATPASQQVTVVDAATFQIVREVNVPRPPANVFASPNLDDPYAYFCDSTGTTLRIDLRQPNRVETLFGRSTTGSVSEDGDILYLKIGSEIASVRLTGKWHAQTSEVLTDTLFLDNNVPYQASLVPPTHGYVGVGRDVRSWDLRKKLGTLGFTPLAFSRQSPLAYGASRQELLVASLNSFETVARLDLPDGFFNSVDDQQPASAAPQLPVNTRLFVDSTRDRLLLASGNKVAVVSLSMLNLPAEPLLSASIRTSVGQVGVESRFALDLADPTASWSLVSGPPGMSANEDSLHWTPVNAGEFPVVIQIQAGNVSRRIETTVSAEQRRITLDFVPIAVAASREGRRLVAWDNEHIALIDLTTIELIGQAPLSTPVGIVALDAESVYLGRTDSTTIQVLSHDFVEERTIEVASAPSQLHATGDGRLFAILKPLGRSIQQTAGGILQVDPADEAEGSVSQRDRVASLVSPRTVQRDYEKKDGIRWLEDDLFLLNDSVWDADLKQRQLLLFAEGFVNYNRERPVEYPALWRLDKREGFGRYFWAIVDSHRLKQAPSYYPRSVPAWYSLEIEQRGTPLPVANSAWFGVRNRFGEEKGRLLLSSQAWQPGESVYVPQYLFTTNDRLVVVIGKKLFCLPLPEWAPTDFPEPFRVRPVQPVLLIPPDGETRLPIQLAGGKAPYTLAIHKPHEQRFQWEMEKQGVGPEQVRVKPWVALGNEIEAAMTLDQASHSLTVNGKLLVEALANNFRAFAIKDGVDKVQENVDLLFRYRQQIEGSFERLVGHRATGIPVAVTVSLDASDAADAEDQLTFDVLVDVPAGSQEELVTRSTALLRQREQDRLGAKFAKQQQRIAESDEKAKKQKEGNAQATWSWRRTRLGYVAAGLLSLVASFACVFRVVRARTQEDAPDEIPQEVARKLSTPALALTIVGWVNLVLSLMLGLGVGILTAWQVPDWLQPENKIRFALAIGPTILLWVLAFPVACIYPIVLAGALRLRETSSYGLALSGALLAALPCTPVFFVSIPVAIWVVVVLMDDGVKRAFQAGQPAKE